MNKRLEPAMNSLIPVMTLLALIAWQEGSIVIDVPGLTAPTIHRGVK